MTTDPSLIERLQAAAAAAIADVGPQLEAVDVRQVRALLLELTMANAGEVTEATCWIERTAAASPDSVARAIGPCSTPQGV